MSIDAEQKLAEAMRAVFRADAEIFRKHFQRACMTGTSSEGDHKAPSGPWKRVLEKGNGVAQKGVGVVWALTYKAGTACKTCRSFTCYVKSGKCVKCYRASRKRQCVNQIKSKH